MVSTRTSGVAVTYSDAFKRQIQRLRRRYRRIRQDLQPIIEHLAAGERPRDQIRALGHTVYKLRVRTRGPRFSSAAAMGSPTGQAALWPQVSASRGSRTLRGGFRLFGAQARHRGGRWAYRVIRFWNDEVLRDPDTVLEEIGRVLIEIPSPYPPGGRGRKRNGSPGGKGRKVKQRARALRVRSGGGYRGELFVSHSRSAAPRPRNTVA